MNHKEFIAKYRLRKISISFDQSSVFETEGVVL